MFDSSSLVINLLEKEIESYKRLLSDKDINLSEGLQDKYKYYVLAYSEFLDLLLQSYDWNKDNIVFNILEANYGKYDTEFVRFDDTSFVISKEDTAMVENNFLLVIDTGGLNAKGDYESPYDYVDKCYSINGINIINTLNDNGEVELNNLNLDK